MKTKKAPSGLSWTSMRRGEAPAVSPREQLHAPSRHWLGVPMLCTLFASCGVSLEYSTSSLARLDAGGVVAIDAGIVDARSGAGESKSILAGRTPAKDFRQLGAAVHAHLVATGVVPPGAKPLAAPTSPQELETVLARATDQGVEVLLLPRLTGAHGSHREHYLRRSINGLFYAMIPFGGVGLLPLLVNESLQIHDEDAYARVTLLVVDCRRRELLGSFDGAGDYKGKSSHWRLNGERRVPDVIRDAVQHALSAYASAASAGFPDRVPLGDHLADVVLSGKQLPHVVQSDVALAANRR